MNKKFLIRLLLDAIMTVIMILLMEYHITGLFLHEALGLAILATILIHNLLNTKWFVGIYRRIFHSRAKSSANNENTSTSRKPKLPIGKLILNLLLLIDTLVLGISGILISKELFPFLHLTKDTFFWKQIHTISSYWMMVVSSFLPYFLLKTFILGSLQIKRALTSLLWYNIRDQTSTIQRRQYSWTLYYIY